MTIFNLFLIAVITVCIIDLSGFIDTFKSVLNKILTKGKISNSDYTLKPIDCSLCMTFWIGLIYLIIYHQLTLLNISILLLIAVSTPIINDVIRLLQDIITKIINIIYNKIQ